MFETPVLFIVFNRPNQTKVVFDRIREIRPKRFYVAADGPRPSKPEDAARIKAVREIIANGVDWDCDLKLLFRENNLGCGDGPAQAISWFFDHEEEGIILEDDCLPSKTFFDFSANCLRLFRSDEQVYNIAGSNFQCGIIRSESSFYFSKYAFTWGWATWRRAWRKFQIDISGADLTQPFRHYHFSRHEVRYWTRVFDETARHELDAWDYSWFFWIWMNKGISIVPTNNLIRNIGIGPDSTHTPFFSEKYELCRLEETGPFKPPIERTINKEADRFYFENFLRARTTLANRLRNIAYKTVPTRWYAALRSLKRQLAGSHSQ